MRWEVDGGFVWRGVNAEKEDQKNLQDDEDWCFRLLPFWTLERCREFELLGGV